MTVPLALRPLYLEQLRRLTADLNRTSERIERLLRCLRESDEAGRSREADVAASARIGGLHNVVPLFPHLGPPSDQQSDGETTHVCHHEDERVR